MEWLDTLKFSLEGVVGSGLCAVGLAINAYAVVTLLRHRLSAVFHKLMLALVAYDFIYVLLVVLCFSLCLLSDFYQRECPSSSS